MEATKKRRFSKMKVDVICNHAFGYCAFLIVWLLVMNFAIEKHSSNLYLAIDAILPVIWLILLIVSAKSKINNKTVRFELLSNDAMLPEKRDDDAGYDIYAVFDENWMIIKPHQTVMIPTKIASAFSSDYVAILKERGSTGTKGMGQRCGVIDASYRGEWFVPITNHNDYEIAIVKEYWMDDFNERFDAESMTIYPYEKAIAQAIFLPVPSLDIEQISQTEYNEQYMNTERGAGALGSSGK